MCSVCLDMLALNQSGRLLQVLSLMRFVVPIARSDKTFNKDLRRLQATRQESRLKFWQKSKPKLF